jgi:autotransporter-associated beta strand protein
MMRGGSAEWVGRVTSFGRLAGLGLLISAMPVMAADLTWNGGATGVWEDGAGGWLNGAVPTIWNNANSDTATLGGTTPLAISIDAANITADSLAVTAGDYTISGPGTLSINSGIISVGSGLTTVLAAPMGGSGGLEKSGDGLLVLTNAGKNFIGPTIIQAGAIQIYASGGGILGATSTQEVQLAGGRLQVQLPSNTVLSNQIVVGVAGGELRNLGTDSQRWGISGSRISGSGVLTMSFGTNNTRYQLVTGQTTFNGKWVLDSGGSQNRLFDIFTSTAFGGAIGDDAITLNNAGSLSLRAGVVLGSATQGIVVAGNGQARILAVGGATVVVASAISGSTSNALQFATENSGSVLIITNTANSWLGETTINGPGVVRVGQTEVIPDVGRNLVISSGATFDLNDHDETIPGLFGAGVVDIINPGDSTLTTGVNNQSPTFSGSIRDSGVGAILNLVKVGTGTQSLSGTNTYEGLTSVEEGVLLLSGQGSIANSFRIDVLPGATLSANIRNDGTLTVGSAQLVTGGGTVLGNLTNNGAVRSGIDGVGTLIVSGRYTQAASASLNVTVVDGVNSAMRITSVATINGTLVVDIDGAMPTAGTVLTVLTASVRSGTFSSMDLAEIGGGLGWELSYATNAVLLSVTGSVASGFAAWASEITNGLTNYNDSATGDGYPNLLKYATGSSPTNADTLARMNGTLAGGTLSLVFNRNTNATDVTMIVEASSSLDNSAIWVGVATNTLGVWSPPPASEVGIGTPVVVTVNDPVPSGTNRFMRLRVTQP